MARYLVGDVRATLATLEPASVDLVLTSPPFLALRSYLPAGHADKPLEIGSEATPGAYIDTLLDVVEALTPVLAPHGSMVFELGDTYSGSGGAGGDYDADGLRSGQPKFAERLDPPRLHGKDSVPSAAADTTTARSRLAARQVAVPDPRTVPHRPRLRPEPADRPLYGPLAGPERHPVV